MYGLRSFVRQSAVKVHLAAADAIYKVTGGKLPKSLFCSRANPQKVGTNVRIIGEGDYWTDIAKFDANGNISDEDFVILSTTDLHLDTDHDLNTKTVEMLYKHIRDSKPDLVILTGDVILSKFQQIDAIQFARMMEKIGVYWTAVFGNHEVREEKGFYKYLLMKSFADYDHCLCKHGPEELFGYGNHVVNIIGKEGKLRKSLFLLDSGRDIIDAYREEHGCPADYDAYDFLKNNQIDFYKKEVDRLTEKYGECKSLMYMHIPLPEYSLAFSGNDKDGFVPSGECEILYGRQFENVGCSKFNSGMFDAILEKGSTQAVFSGHDHINDWCAIYKGVYLVYNQPDCYNLYHIGTKKEWPEKDWTHGVTLTTLHADGSLDFAQRFNSLYI